MGKKDAATKASVDKRIYGDLSSDEEPAETLNTKSSRSKKQKPKGIRWSIVGLLALFILPGIFGAFSYLYDFLYPEAAERARYRNKLVQCYTAANPSKLSSVDRFLDKYKDKENALFAQLRELYPKVPECR